MNIHTPDPIYRDPFQQSDRGGFGPRNGKGDSPRNVGTNFGKNFDKIKGMGKNKKPGKTTYRYK